MNHQSFDLRDVVKDSMYREARALSHKTKTENEAPYYVLGQLIEANWYGDEPRELSRSKSCQFRDGFSLSISKDFRRFSYDGRETDISKTTTTNQLKELPRLSLDSRERSMRTLSSVSVVPFFPIKPAESKSNPPSRNPKVGYEKGLIQIQTRPPSVVAKLMGLETFPHSVSTVKEKLDVGPIRSHQVEDLNSLSRSSEASDSCVSVKMHNSTRSSMKPISRVLTESAPWKQSAPHVIRSSNKIQTPVSSVYSQVDKRLKNLEFARSGKDLRALKQILEAMQAVEAKKGKMGNSVERPSDHEMSAKESHIVIMKSRKLVGKGFVNNKEGKDPITECRRGERQLRPPSMLSDSGKSRKQSKSNKQQSELRSPSGRRQRISNFQKSNDQNKEVCVTISKNQSCSLKLAESVSPEYPSPVSVLDYSVYMENSSSHVNHTPHTRKDYATQNPPEKVVKDQNGATKNGVSCTINREKLQQVEHLVQKLKRLNSSHDETHTDYIAYLCENTNPDDKYITKILLASGLLLRDLESFEFHSSGHPINPDLFLVLEQTKFSNLQNEKLHRKLIFDSVNAILEKKLESGCKDARKLLRELCLEIDGLKKREGCFGEDLLKNWRDFDGENLVIMVEVERLIFKDLINEVVTDV